ncbi:MAG: hypothetical protein ABI614_27590 [Planctomycetota bacterium]
MSKRVTSWFAVTAAAGLTFSLLNAGTVAAQPPGRGPGGPDAPGRGDPPNVDEMFSRMDKNNDGKLSKDEVPGPVWERLSNADSDGDGAVTKDEAAKAIAGRRPDGGRPDGPRPEGGRPDGARHDDGRPDGAPSDRPREESAHGRGPRPPMEHGRGDSPRGESRGPREAGPEHGRPAPPHSPNQPDREHEGRPDNAHRGPSSFGPDAFFDRLDKNHDGSLSRDEFHAVAEMHRGQQSPRGPQGFSGPHGPSGHRGPSGPPMAHRGPDMRGGSPPWAHGGRGNSFGQQGFHGGPPWAHAGQGPQFHGRSAGPPWAQSAQRPHGPRGDASPQGPPHRGTESRDDHPRHDHPRNDQRSPSRRPDHRDRTDANTPQSDVGVTIDDAPSASPSDATVTSSTAANAATLPL